MSAFIGGLSYIFAYILANYDEDRERADRGAGSPDGGTYERERHTLETSSAVQRNQTIKFAFFEHKPQNIAIIFIEIKKLIKQRHIFICK